jgi:hypothetical protein
MGLAIVPAAQLPLSAVAVWGAELLLVHVTLEPAGTLVAAGLKHQPGGAVQLTIWACAAAIASTDGARASIAAIAAMAKADLLMT